MIKPRGCFADDEQGWQEYEKQFNDGGWTNMMEIKCVSFAATVEHISDRDIRIVCPDESFNKYMLRIGFDITLYFRTYAELKKFCLGINNAFEKVMEVKSDCNN